MVLQNRPGRLDAVTVLTVYLVLLFAVPASMVVRPLGEAGRPARIFGLILLAWWTVDFLARPQREQRRRTMVRIAMAAFCFAMGAGYLSAVVRPINGPELSGADRSLLAFLSWCGVFLVAADGIVSHERLDLLIRRMVLAVGLVAALGIAQFVTGRPLVDVIDIPGFAYLADVSLGSRQGYTRPAGTAVHPIEFGAVLGIGLALSLHVAVNHPELSGRRRWLPVAAISLAVPISGSRSAFVSSAVVLLMVIPTWSRPLRHNALVALLAVGGASVVVAPSFLRSIYRLFTGIGTDDSTTSRTDSYGLVLDQVSKHPIFGRGLGTFLPEYRILDNQYLGTAIETGVLGVTALLGLLVCGIATAEAMRALHYPAIDRQLGRALSASAAATLTSWFFYDGLGFPINSGLVFLVLGVTAAARQLQDESVSVVNAR